MKVEGQGYLKLHLGEKKINANPFQNGFKIFVGQDDMNQAFWDGNVRLKNNKKRDNL